MKVLITGIAGLLGSHLAKWITANTSDKILGVDDLSCGDPANCAEFPTVIATIGKADLRETFREFQPDVVFHFAAYAAEGLSPFIRKYNYTNNLTATADIVNNCILFGVRRLVFTSSMAVYGDGDPPFWENHLCKPMDPYGIAKLAAEQDIRCAAEQHGLPYCILRPHNVYGEGQVCTQKYRNVLGIWMRRAVEGMPLLVYGDGEQERAFSYIGDCVEPIYNAAISAEAQCQTINIGGPTPVKIGRAAEIVSEVVGGAGIRHVQGRHEAKYAWCTTKRSEELLGYEHKTPFREGVERMWKWFLRHDHPDVPLPEVEIDAGLYPYWK